MSEATSAAQPPRRRRKQARPNEIIAAGLSVFAERGYAAARLEDVAARAGIGKGTIYLYFPSKEALFRAAVRVGIVPVFDALDAIAADSTGPAAELLRLIAARMLALIESEFAAIPRLVLSEAANFPEIARFYAEEVGGRGRRLIGGVLLRGMERGEFRRMDPGPLVPLFVAPLLLVVVAGSSLGRHVKLPFEPERIIAAHLDLFLRGLAPAGGAAPDPSP